MAHNFFSKISKSINALSGSNISTSEEVSNCLTQAYNKGNTEIALAYYDRALDIILKQATVKSAIKSDVYHKRGFVLQSLGYHLEAIDDFSEAIKIQPDDCNLYFGRSVSWGAVGRIKESLADIDISIELSRRPTERNNQYHKVARANLHVASATEWYLLSRSTTRTLDSHEQKRLWEIAIKKIRFVKN